MNVPVAISKVLARFHRWYPTAAVLAGTPLSALDNTSVGRLRYSLLMAHRTNPEKTRALLAKVIKRDREASPEIQIELSAMATATGQPRLASELLQAAEQATSPYIADAARRLRALNEAGIDGSLETKISSIVDALSLGEEDGLLTLAPVSGKYLEMWQLWLEQTRKHVGGRIVAMAMDDVAFEALRAEPDVAVADAREFFSWDERGSIHARTRGVLWYVRVLYLCELVRRGHRVLVLDLDAIAISDLGPMLAALPSCDVVAQKDHSIPVDVDRELGFILCCGFMLWQPTAAAKALLDRFATEAFIERDDQLALNHLLARDGIVGKTENAQCMQFGSAGVQFVCPDPSQVSRSLNTGSVVRHFHQHGQSIAELRNALGLS